MSKLVFSQEVEPVEKPVRMAYIGTHPVCGHTLNAAMERGTDTAKEAALWAFEGLVVSRVTGDQARAALMSGKCGTCQPPEQLNLLGESL